MTVQSYKNLICTIILLVIVALQPIFAQKIVYSKPQIEKISTAKKRLKEAIEKKDSLKIADAYYYIGRYEGEAGNFLTSQNFYIKSLKILETKGDSYELGRLYFRLYGVEYAQGHYARSLKFLQTAITIYQRVKSDFGLSQGYSNYADFFVPDPTSKKSLYFKPSYDSVLFYYKKGEYYSRKIKDTLGLAYLQFKLGYLYESLSNPKAIPYYQSVFNIYFSRNDKRLMIHSMLSLASAYIVFKEPKKAYILILKAEHLYQKHYQDEHETQLHLERVYVKYFQAIGNWNKAFKHLKTLNNLEKNETMADNEGAVSRLNIEYETQKKEIQLNKQKQELELRSENIRIQNQFLITLSLLLCLMVVLSIVFYRLYRKNQQISLKNTILVKEQNHRVKNNLQVVSSLLSLQSNRLSDEAAKQAVEESMLRIETMAILHRKLYDGEDLAIVNLSDFIMELVDGVLQTFGIGSIELRYSINNIKLSADQALSIGLIVNELVTNACKYAFRQHPKPHLSISCVPDNDELMLTVSDNGLNPKMYHKINTSSEIQKTFGMRLIQMQIAQLYGTFNYISGSGTTFTMRFKPLNNFVRK